MTNLDVKCRWCKTSFTRQVKTFEPEKFNPRGTKSVLTQFWCRSCGKPLAARYEFYRDKQHMVQARVVKYVELDEVFVPRKPRQNITVKTFARYPGRKREIDDAEQD